MLFGHERWKGEGMKAKPNVVVLVADDHRASALGIAGSEPVKTPNLDRLAAAGLMCTRAYTMGGMTPAVCVPSRACLLTGRSTFDAVASRNDNDYPGLQTLRSDRSLLPEHFRQHGYATHGIGKWHNDAASFNRCFAGGDRIFMGGMSDHDAVPVHRYDDSAEYAAGAATTGQGHSTDIFADAAIEFLANRPGGEPFFLYAAFTAPHDPRTPPDYWQPAYREVTAGMDLPPNAYPEHPFDMDIADIRDELLEETPRPSDRVRNHLADYYDMITHLDTRVGDILSTLESTGLADNTLVLYLSDHGLSVGQHGLMGKQNMYEHSLRIPCVMRGPGVTPGTTASGLVTHADVFPTLCELAGLPVPEGLTSQRLWRGRTGTVGDPDSCLMGVYRHVHRCVIADQWKLVRYYRQRKRGIVPGYRQLFNLRDDPFEIRNLAYFPEHEALAREMTEALDHLQARYRDPMLELLA